MANEHNENDVSIRISTILKIDVLEQLTPVEEGMELNEGYQFEVNGPIPQMADGIAKMAFEMDKDPDLGIKSGGAFLALIAEYYKLLVEGGNPHEATGL